MIGVSKTRRASLTLEALEDRTALSLSAIGTMVANTLAAANAANAAAERGASGARDYVADGRHLRALAERARGMTSPPAGDAGRVLGVLGVPGDTPVATAGQAPQRYDWLTGLASLSRR